MKPSTPSTSTLDDKRRRAYQAGGRITRDRMTREAPMNAEALDAIETSDIVVVEGCYDHVELVLGALDLPYQAIKAGHLGRVHLRPEQLLVINCPGQLPHRRSSRSVTSWPPAAPCFPPTGRFATFWSRPSPGLTSSTNTPPTTTWSGSTSSNRTAHT